MNSTAVADSSRGVARADGGRTASLLVLGQMWLTTFSTRPHREAVEHASIRRVAQDGSSGRSGGRNVPVMFEVDPLFAAHEGAGTRNSVAAVVEEMVSRSDIVKLGERDLAWLRPCDRHWDATRWLMSRGPAILIVTHGPTAATAYSRSGSVHVRNGGSVIADTQDWEDAFVAGLLHALTARGLHCRSNSQQLRAIGLDELRGVMRDAHPGA